MKTSILKDADFEEIYQKLGNSPDKIFDSMKDIMIFCALIAMRKGMERKPISKRGGEPIKIDIFREDDKNIIDIIALNEYGNLSILTDEMNEEKLNIFEEFSNAGMSYIKESHSGIPEHKDIRKLVDEFRPIYNSEKDIDITELKM